MNMDNLCRDIIKNYIHKKVVDARIDLGYHFNFDFDYMLFSKPNQTHVYIHGPGIYVRIYNIFGLYILDNYLDIKMIYETNEKYITEYIKNNDDDYCIKILADHENDKIVTNMTIYFQKYLIRNKINIIDELNIYFNR